MELDYWVWLKIFFKKIALQTKSSQDDLLFLKIFKPSFSPNQD